MEKNNQLPNLTDREVSSSFYEKIILSVLEIIIRRYEADPEYPFIDTKLDVITGRDFPAEDRIRGKHTVYSWIQSRGLEALAAHAEWRPEYKSRIVPMVTEISGNMEEIRKMNNGHLPCMMTTDGMPLRPVSPATVEQLPVITDSQGTLSDLFYVKGLAAAADLLQNLPLLFEAEKMYLQIVDDLFAQRFVFDQHSLDPKNLIRTECIMEGGFMIAIGGAVLFLKLTHNPKYWEIGLRLINHILENYVNTIPDPEFGKQYDMWEEVDDKAIPLLTDGILRSDPGHALEFAGLSLKLIYLAEKQGIINSDENKISELIGILCQIISVNFANGFAKYGIVKSFDIVAQQTFNSDLPWWSLPESMRSANFAHYFTADPACLVIFKTCANAFVENFLNEKVHWMAYQTLDKKGQPVRVIPATPDADPGYHTGLSLLDVFELLSLK